MTSNTMLNQFRTKPHGPHVQAKPSRSMLQEMRKLELLRQQNELLDHNLDIYWYKLF